MKGLRKLTKQNFLLKIKILFKFYILELLFYIFERNEANFAGEVGYFGEKFNDIAVKKIDNKIIR